MALEPQAVWIANDQVWKAYPELKRRQLTAAPGDKKYRQAWISAYSSALSKKPPKPAAMPKPSQTPLSSAPPGCVTSCTPTTKKTVSKCSEIKPFVRAGDIVLRSTPGADSDMIRKAAKCDYSHAGIVVENAAGDLVVVDAYPGRSGGAVKEESIDDFFCGHGTFKGLASRPKDSAKAKKAAEWALAQTTDPAYDFEIFSPWNSDPKTLYCSDFVYQSFQNAGVDLVPKKMDFLSRANRQNTIDAAREYATKEETRLAKVASDSKIESELRKQAKGSEYITPCQVAMNAETEIAVEFDAAPTGGGGASKK